MLPLAPARRARNGKELCISLRTKTAEAETGSSSVFGLMDETSTEPLVWEA